MNNLKETFVLKSYFIRNAYSVIIYSSSCCSKTI